MRRSQQSSRNTLLRSRGRQDRLIHEGLEPRHMLSAAPGTLPSQPVPTVSVKSTVLASAPVAAVPATTVPAAVTTGAVQGTGTATPVATAATQSQLTFAQVSNPRSAPAQPTPGLQPASRPGIPLPLANGGPTWNLVSSDRIYGKVTPVLLGDDNNSTPIKTKSAIVQTFIPKTLPGLNVRQEVFGVMLQREGIRNFGLDITDPVEAAEQQLWKDISGFERPTGNFVGVLHDALDQVGVGAKQNLIRFDVVEYYGSMISGTQGALFLLTKVEYSVDLSSIPAATNGAGSDPLNDTKFVSDAMAILRGDMGRVQALYDADIGNDIQGFGQLRTYKRLLWDSGYQLRGLPARPAW